eukprot:1627100-Pleurochrysis_carterae.AAC.1
MSSRFWLISHGALTAARPPLSPIEDWSGLCPRPDRRGSGLIWVEQRYILDSASSQARLARRTALTAAAATRASGLSVEGTDRCGCGCRHYTGDARSQVVMRPCDGCTIAVDM